MAFLLTVYNMSADGLEEIRSRWPNLLNKRVA